MIESVNVHGGSGDPNRGSWCTPKWLCDVMGEYDLDPCSNDRSHVKSRGRYQLPQFDGLAYAPTTSTGKRTFINPPYESGSVIRWVNAYHHTDFTFLLRWDPSTEWFAEIAKHARFFWFPLGRRINFEPPPGVKASSSSACHALYMKSEPSKALQEIGMTLTNPGITNGSQPVLSLNAFMAGINTKSKDETSG